MLIDDVFDTGVRPNKDQLIAWGEGVEVNAISSKHFEIVANGTDQTTAIAIALASGENINFERGVIGYDGDAGLAVSLAGQILRGAGTTDVPTAPTRGTVFKRLSGTGVGLAVPLYLEGVEISNICFDQNNLGGSALLFKGHKGRLKNLVFHNQGGTAFACRVSGVNLLQAENIIGTGTNYGLLKIETDAVALYGSFYSTFKGVRSLNPTTSNAILINGSSALRMYDTFVESEIYITAGNGDIRLYGLAGELGARSLLKVDGLTGGSSEVMVKGGKVNVFENATASIPFFDLANTYGVTIEDFSFTDAHSVANRVYVNLSAVEGFSARNITGRNTSGNSHYLFRTTAASARSDRVCIENIHALSGTLLCDMEMSGIISNSNVPCTFIAGTQKVTCINVQANVNTANAGSGIQLIGCTDVTDTNNLASYLDFAGMRGSPVVVASAAELALSLDNATVHSVTGNVDITSIRASASFPGRIITLLFAGSLTFTDGNNLALAGNFVTSANASITLACNASSVWIEMCRSAN